MMIHISANSAAIMVLEANGSCALAVNKQGIYVNLKWVWVIAFIPQPIGIWSLGVGDFHTSHHPPSSNFGADHEFK